jgi:hypothetical protein
MAASAAAPVIGPIRIGGEGVQSHRPPNVGPVRRGVEHSLVDFTELQSIRLRASSYRLAAIGRTGARRRSTRLAWLRRPIGCSP